MTLEERMKKYEAVNQTYLDHDKPVIIRIDGKKFSKFTRAFNKPFDEIINKCMAITAEKLFSEIHGCRFVFTSSDEINLILLPCESPYFKNNIQKISSITSGLATLYFNEELYKQGVTDKLFMASFDSRCFNSSEDEIVNYLIWRQSNSHSNAINTTARSYLTAKQMERKSIEQLFEELGDTLRNHLDSLPTSFRNGISVFKREDQRIVDLEVPLFTKDRDYIKDKLFNQK